VVAGSSRASPRTPRKSSNIDARARTAYHEAGHGVLSAALSATPKHVSIRPTRLTLGRSGARLSPWPMIRAQVHLAGFAAEHLLTGRRPRQLDQEIGFGILARTDPELRASFEGAQDFDGHRAVEAVLGMIPLATDDDVRREVNRYYAAARDSLAAVWPSVERVAAALLEHEHLDRRGVESALGDVDLFAPVVVVQRAHGVTPPARP
jgi:hypothetical protein